MYRATENLTVCIVKADVAGVCQLLTASTSFSLLIKLSEAV